MKELARVHSSSQSIYLSEPKTTFTGNRCSDISSFSTPKHNNRGHSGGVGLSSILRGLKSGASTPIENSNARHGDDCLNLIKTPNNEVDSNLKRSILSNAQVIVFYKYELSYL